MIAVNDAINWCLEVIETRNCIYDWTTGSKKVLNSDTYNCSTFLITAWYAAGVYDGYAYNTESMYYDFPNYGFTWIDRNNINLSSTNDLLPGDILLNIYLHTEMYIGDGLNVNAGASDEVPCTKVVGYRDFPWDGILRYTGV